MSRSLKKGPFIEFKLEKRVLEMNKTGKKSVVKTWSRRSLISPDFVGHTIAFITGINSSRCMLPRIWSDTGWVNFHQPVHSGDMPEKLKYRQNPLNTESNGCT
jgi:hypothetical protein